MTDNINNKLENRTNIKDINGLSQHLSDYIKAQPSRRTVRAIPPLHQWHPQEVSDMDLIIKANGEWWHEGTPITRQSLVCLFATILWKEDNNGIAEYFLKTPVQKLRIQVEDVPLLIHDVGIVTDTPQIDDKNAVSWLEFVTTTGDVIRLDEAHPIILKNYSPNLADGLVTSGRKEISSQVRPYILVRDGLMALIGRNTFYHLIDIGDLTEHEGTTILTLHSGGRAYELSMPE